MRVALAVMIATVGVAHADGDATDHDRADLAVKTAEQLARDGHCREAIALRAQITSLDSAAATRAFSEDAALEACVAPTSPTGNTSAVEAPVLPARGYCSSGLYLSPSLVVSVGTQSTVLNRFAAGVTLRSCTSPMVVAFGATAFIGGPDGLEDGGGGGGELEISRWTRAATRIGGHASVESLFRGGYLASLDLRLHVDDIGWVGAGLSYARDQYGDPPIGGTIGVGVEGKRGAAIAGIELGFGVGLVVAVLYGLASNPG